MSLTFACVSFVLSVTVSSDCSATYTATIGSTTLPRKDNRIAVGYDTKTESILAIGGQMYPKQLFKFLVNKQEFLDISNDTLSTRIEGSAPFYTQIGDTLWMIDESGASFVTFNLETYELKETDIKFPLPVGVGFGCLASDEHHLFVVGGDGTFTQTMDTIQIYDIDAAEWIQHIVTLQTGRYLAACIVVNETLYTIGGTHTSDDPITTIETLYVGDTSSIKQQTSQFMDQELSTQLLGSRAVQYGPDILLIGGYDGTGYVSDVIVIDTETQSVRVCGSLAIGAMYTAAIIVDQILYVFGGYNSNRAWNHWYLDSYQYINLAIISTTEAPTAPASGISTTAFPERIKQEEKTSAKWGSAIAIAVSILVILVIGIFAYCALTKRRNGDKDIGLLKQDIVGKDADEYYML